MTTPHPILRRDFLSSLSGGFTGLALTQMLAREASGSFAKPELNGGIHHRAKVKRVIQLFMNGGVSPMDTWDYKPALTKLDGQKLGSKTKIEGATGMQGALMKSPFEFKQHGQCGKWVSSLFPEQAKLVDEMAFLQAMTGRSNVHGQNAYLLNNGFLLPGFPCMGAWISYALGSLSDNLPASSCCRMRVDCPTTVAAASPPVSCPPCIRAPLSKPTRHSPSPISSPPTSSPTPPAVPMPMVSLC